MDSSSFFNALSSLLDPGQLAQIRAWGAQARTSDPRDLSRELVRCGLLKLTYRYSGRDYRLTDVDGKVAKEIIA